MPPTLIGLDVGTSGVRAAELVPKRRTFAVKRFAEVPLPRGVVRAGAVVDPDALAESLRELWSEGRFGSRRVVLGIANAGVLVRQVDLEWMPPEDFRRALRYQVQDVLPFPVEDANLDYYLLGEPEVPDAQGVLHRKARVLLVAAARDVVDSLVTAVRAARLQVDAVDLMPFALVRARTPDGLTPAGPVEAIVDIGADLTSVVVHAGGVPRFVRMIAGLGGDTITHAVQQRYDWSWDDAESTKVALGLEGRPAVPADPFAAVEGPHPAQATIAAAAEQLVAEIEATLDYYRTSTADLDGAMETVSIDRLLLSGSGSRLGGLDGLLGDRLGLAVSSLDVREHLRVGRAELDAQQVSALAVPTGLCVGSAR
ncbi:MAG TPA: type IV pilus assembly protein PilM [Nocardioides sp.]|uniref:type IV pilus assembly protein PilM n=1 Tax=Nocardioides sp. TaxID=35761 RepID=UPI002CE5892F|nr:type IV pilus assembly protein PilM [Nocardioides sp.]HTW16815.1 type IV pilus assembly protein PilM [Nocardioides sp.]